MEINADTTSATVTLDIRGTYTADELRQVLQEVCAARAQIAKDPATPVGLSPPVAINGHWYTEALSGDPAIGVLAILVPGFGWAAVSLSNRDRCLLAHYLIGQATIAASTASSGHGAKNQVKLQSGGGGSIH